MNSAVVVPVMLACVMLLIATLQRSAGLEWHFAAFLVIVNLLVAIGVALK